MAKLLSTFQDFSLGLNDKAAPNLLHDMELAESQNCFVGRGTIDKRNGYVPYATLAANYLYEFYKSNYTSEFIAVSGTTLYKDSSGTFNPVTMTNSLNGTSIKKNHIKPFTDSSWTLLNGAVATTRTNELLIFSSNYSTGVNVQYELDSFAVSSVKGKQTVLSMETYSMSDSDGYMPISIKTVANPSWTTLATVFADSSNTSNKTVSMTFPADTTNIKIEVYRDTPSANNLPITLKKMQLEIGTVATTFELYEITKANIKMVTYNDRSMNDVVLIADGGKLKTYNGTEVKEVTPHVPTTGENSETNDPGLNDLVNLTKFRTLVINGERVYACAHPTNRNRINFCHIDPMLGYGVYDYFPATHFFDVAVDDNDEIIELKLFRDAVIAFCKRSVWALYGNGRTANDYQLIKINVPTGCIAPNSIVEVGNTIFYLSDTHIYSLTSTDKNYISAEVVSERIETTLNGISLADKQDAVGTFYKDKYYLSFPDGTTVIFDNLIANWTVFTNIAAKSYLNRAGVLHFAGSKIYKFDENTWSDDGVPIATRIKFKNMDLGFPIQNKKIRKLWVIAKQYEELASDYSIKAIVDYIQVDIDDITTDQSLVWDEGDWDDTLWDFKEVVQNELRIRKSGKNFQLIITSDSIDQPFTFYGFAFEYKLKKP